MRKFVIFAFFGVGIGIATAYAQDNASSKFTATPVQPHSSSGNTYVGGGGGYGRGYHSSTAAEGRLRGMGALVRSAGQANLDNSGAAINYSIARSNQIQNRAEYTNTYFQMRQANRAYRAEERGPRGTQEDFVRYAQAGMPKRLSPGELDTVTGAVNWPIFLRSDDLAKDRAELEAIFAERASKGVINTDDYMKVTKVTKTMMDDLKGRAREIPPNQYAIAKNFLSSLAYEATLPAN